MDLQPGDMLNKDVFNNYGLHVLSAQTILNRECIARLLSHNIDYIDIERSTANVETDRHNNRPFDETPSLHVSHEASLSGIRTLFGQSQEDNRIDPKVVDASFEPLVDCFPSETSLVSLILNLSSDDEYTYQHSVQVGVLSYYISRWLGYSEEKALTAGKAGFLHDIGKSRIDPAILSKPARLTDEEFEIIKTHPVHGHQILVEAYGDKSPISLAALQHHERMDGRGYPKGLTDSQIDPVAKIVAVADIYSAMICSRVYQKEQDMLFVLQELHRLSFGEIDPHITQTFIRNMIPNFVRKTVILTSGERGTIVLTNPTDFFRPFIQIDNQFYDLSERQDLVIHKILV
jgi:putative nucleotidyltransferase with HDIG domain